MLAAVFLAAASGKLLDRPGSEDATLALGVPGWLARPVAFLLPLVELGVAAALLVPASATWGAIAALVLLVLLTALVAGNLAAGRRPDCHCFGRLRAEPLSGGVMARNAILAALAAYLVIERSRLDDGSVVGWRRGFEWPDTTVVVVGAAVLLVLAVEIWRLRALTRSGTGLRRRAGVLARRLRTSSHARHGLRPGAAAPFIVTRGLDGNPVSTRDLLVGSPVVLIFVHPACSPCTDLLPGVEAWQTEHAGVLTLAVIGHGTEEQMRPLFADRRLQHALVDESDAVATTFRIPTTPAAVVVDESGRIASRPAVGHEAIDRLVVSSAVERLRVHRRPPAPTGDSGRSSSDGYLLAVDSDRSAQ